LPQEGCLLVANHRSYIDVIALLNYLPVTFLARADLANWPLLGWASRSVNTIFVQRDNKDSRRASRLEIAKVLATGASVLVFPEGTTSEGPDILPFRMGPFQIALDGGFPVVPVAIEYANVRDAWAGDETFIRHFIERLGSGGQDITVVFGPHVEGGTAEEMKDRAEDWVRETLLAIHKGEYK
jgi:1-acyl-sn-glycerol-3-phosphate acyltransferase